VRSVARLAIRLCQQKQMAPGTVSTTMEMTVERQLSATVSEGIL
jgi:hypothetical protein